MRTETKPLLPLFFLVALGWGAFGQETATVQVTPSDQVIYPDASQILNKTDPKATPKAGLPSAKPLVASTPVPAGKVAARNVGPGWYLRWVLSGDQASVQAWASALGRPAQVLPLTDGSWEVLAGPFTGDGLGQALAGQAGKAQLVRR